MTTKEMIETLRYKAENIKAHIEPEFFNDVADVLEKYQWIDVNDRLPESNVNVLWTGAKNGMFIGYIFNDKYLKECAMRDGKVCVSVLNGRNLRQGVAWMPLPEPYKKEV